MKTFASFFLLGFWRSPPFSQHLIEVAKKQKYNFFVFQIFCFFDRERKPPTSEISFWQDIWSHFLNVSRQGYSRRIEREVRKYFRMYCYVALWKKDSLTLLNICQLGMVSLAGRFYGSCVTSASDIWRELAFPTESKTTEVLISLPLNYWKVCACMCLIMYGYFFEVVK